MKNHIVTIFIILICSSVEAQIGVEDYERAENFLYSNIKKNYYNSWVSPQWNTNQQMFWYSINSRKGKEYVKYMLQNNTKEALFDQEKLAILLSTKLEKEIEAYELGLNSVTLDSTASILRFSLEKKSFEYIIGSGSLKEANAEVKDSDLSILSPDKKKLAWVDGYNIWIKDISTNDTVQITKDGSKFLAYGVGPKWNSIRNIESDDDYDLELDISWSPDSRYFIAGKYDRRNARNLYLYKTLADDGNRAEVYKYERPLAGDSLVPTLGYILIDTDVISKKDLDLKFQPTFLNYGFSWIKDNAYQLRYRRGYQSLEIVEIDASKGKTRIVFEESTSTFLEQGYSQLKLLKKSKEILWLSEADGWNHIYRINRKNGNIIKQVTRGDFFVKKIIHVDESSSKVYFTAGGRESNIDPYYLLLYVVNYDGSGLKLLSPEKATHNISISTDKKYFVDNYSTVQQPNVSVLRSLEDGKLIKVIEEGDIKDLEKMGWQKPEPFNVKARDGKTDIYGVIYKPHGFDPNKKYPIIDGTYSGPQTIRSPKSFSQGLRYDDLSISQLGFVMINIDGMGSAFRSKAFHDVCHKNLGDIGGPDHIKAIITLARDNSWMDTTRVGIFGHSAGGYDAAHALLVYPEFYKVGVSTAGNHDHRAAKAWWPELYMGYPVGDNYDEQSNYNLVENLKGNLLIVHGDMDENVNPTASYRLAAELIKANKDFDLLIIPGKNHGQTYYDKYLIRKRWDYFVRYLMGEEPPKEYLIK